MNLEETASSMLEQFPSGAVTALDRQEKALEKFGALAFGGFGVVGGAAVLALIYVILTKMILSRSQPVAGIFLLAFLVFAALSLTYVVWRESLIEKQKKVASSRDLNVLPDHTSNLLTDKPFEPPPSVVEDTTALLSTKRNTKNLS